MNNLPSKKEQFNPVGYNWNESESNILIADHNGLSIKKKSSHELKKTVIIAITNAINNCQSPKTEDEISVLSTKVFNSIRSRFNTMKLEEFILAVELGSTGEYNTVDDIVYVSHANVLKWLKTYLNRKQKLILRYREEKEKEALKEANITSIEKEEKYWLEFPEKVREEFLYYKANGLLSDAGYRICRGLESIYYMSGQGKGFLGTVISPSEKNIIRSEEQKKAITKEVERKQKTMVVFSAKSVKVETLETLIIQNCKERCLMKYFDIEESIDLEYVKSLIGNKN